MNNRTIKQTTVTQAGWVCARPEFARLKLTRSVTQARKGWVSLAFEDAATGRLIWGEAGPSLAKQENSARAYGFKRAA